MERAPNASGNSGNYLEDVEDNDDDSDDSSGLEAGEDHTHCHAHPPLSDEAVVADDAGSGSSDKA